MKLSFVIPCYRSENTIEEVVNEIKEKMKERPEYQYEVILVNDHSPDGVVEKIKRMANEDKRIKGIDLARNRGKAAAVLAGISRMQGDAMVLLDDDGQCPLDRLWDLLQPIIEGHDMATAVYPQQKQASWKKLGSRFNQRLMRHLVGQPKGIEFSNFNIRKRFLCEEMAKYQNPYPNLQGLTLQVTHDIVGVPMVERDRIQGKSGYTFIRSLKLLVNGCTGFSVIPLRVASVLGILFSLLGGCFGIYTIISRLLNPEMLSGYASTIALLLFVGGIIMMLLGIIGEYLGRIYICINNSPQYVIRQEWNTKDEPEVL